MTEKQPKIEAPKAKSDLPIIAPENLSPEDKQMLDLLNGKLKDEASALGVNISLEQDGRTVKIGPRQFSLQSGAALLINAGSQRRQVEEEFQKNGITWKVQLVQDRWYQIWLQAEVNGRKVYIGGDASYTVDGAYDSGSTDYEEISTKFEKGVTDSLSKYAMWWLSDLIKWAKYSQQQKLNQEARDKSEARAIVEAANML